MISDQIKDTLVDQIIKGLIGQGTEGLRPVLELLFNTAMKVEREQFLEFWISKPFKPTAMATIFLLAFATIKSF